MHESNKFKYGMAVLVIGVLLIVWAWGSWTLRVARTPTPSTTYDSSANADEVGDDNSMTVPASSEKKVDATAWRFFLFVLLALFLIVLFGSYFLIRIARRYRARTDHDRAPPTKFEDVWSMHKLPKE